jgi:hypothetical protein
MHFTWYEYIYVYKAYTLMDVVVEICVKMSLVENQL